MGVEQDGHWYEAEELSAVLEARLAKLNQQQSEEISALACFTDLAPNQFSTFVEKDRGENPTARYQLIPYNLGNNHWVGICLEYYYDNEPKEAKYMDSLNPDSKSIKEAIRIELNSLGFDDGMIHKVNNFTQQDGSSCGAFTVENLLWAAGLSTIEEGYDAATIRSIHACLLQERNDQIIRVQEIRQGDIGIIEKPSSTSTTTREQAPQSTPGFFTSIYNFFYGIYKSILNFFGWGKETSERNELQHSNNSKDKPAADGNSQANTDGKKNPALESNGQEVDPDLFKPPSPINSGDKTRASEKQEDGKSVKPEPPKPPSN